MSDAEDLRHARNAVLYGGKQNPLVEWTLSPEWTEIHESATKGKRGSWFTEHDVYWGNEVRGEIQCR